MENNTGQVLSVYDKYFGYSGEVEIGRYTFAIRLILLTIIFGISLYYINIFTLLIASGLGIIGIIGGIITSGLTILIGVRYYGIQIVKRVRNFGGNQKMFQLLNYTVALFIFLRLNATYLILLKWGLDGKNLHIISTLDIFTGFLVSIFIYIMFRKPGLADGRNDSKFQYLLKVMLIINLVLTIFAIVNILSLIIGGIFYTGLGSILLINKLAVLQILLNGGLLSLPIFFKNSI